MITPYNLLRHELVGLNAKAQVGQKTLVGQIVAESANTLTIKTEQGRKKALKANAVFEVEIDEKAIVEVDGLLLKGRGEDRIKKKQRIRF